MSILIELSRAAIECLLDQLPQGSDLRQKLSNAETTVFSNIRAIGPSNPSVCTEDEAIELLRLAKAHCPNAVEEIQRAMKLCGVKF